MKYLANKLVLLYVYVIKLISHDMNIIIKLLFLDIYQINLTCVA